MPQTLNKRHGTMGLFHSMGSFFLGFNNNRAIRMNNGSLYLMEFEFFLKKMYMHEGVLAETLAFSAIKTPIRFYDLFGP